MSIRTLVNRGDAFYDKSTNTAYVRKDNQPTPGYANFNPTPEDTYDIGPIGIKNGPDLTAAGHAVAEYVAAGCQPSYTISSSDEGSMPAFWTVPYTGTAYFYASAEPDLRVRDMMGSNAVLKKASRLGYYARTMTVAAGTVLHIARYRWSPSPIQDYQVGTTIYYALRPDVWPP